MYRRKVPRLMVMVRIVAQIIEMEVLTEAFEVVRRRRWMLQLIIAI